MERIKAKLVNSKSLRALPILIGVLVFACSGLTQAIEIGTRTLKISSAEPSATNVQYELTIDRASSGTLGSLQLEICTNDPFAGTPCTIPAGLSFSAASVLSQAGVSGFSVSGFTTPNSLILTRTASAVAAGPLEITIGNVQNPSSTGTYFGRIQTFASTDGTGVADDQGGLAIAIVQRVGVTAEVPPFLTLCVATEFVGLNCNSGTNSFVDFGEFSWTAHAKATSQIIIASNAQYGANLFVIGNTLISGNNVIPAMTVNGAAQTNVSQFGINLRANPSVGFGSDPVGPGIVTPSANYNAPNSFRFNTGELIASSPGSTNYSKLTVSYLVDVNQNQSPGIYNSTIIYTALASF